MRTATCVPIDALTVSIVLASNPDRETLCCAETDVAEVQKDVDNGALTMAVADMSVDPKLKPVTVTLEMPVEGRFQGVCLDNDGGSKLNCCIAVPATAPTVTVVSTCIPATLVLGRQETELADDHALVLHLKFSSCIVAVGSYPPKLKPVTVTDAIPDAGIFREEDVIAAASKLKADALVPATAPTVKGTHKLAPPSAFCWAHTTLDVLVQDAVQHFTLPIIIDKVGSVPLKLEPDNTIERWAVVGAFDGKTAEATGASKLNTETSPVPAIAETVIVTRVSVLDALRVKHTTLVEDDHVEVRQQSDSPIDAVPVNS